MPEAWITDAAHAPRGTGKPDTSARHPIARHGLLVPALDERQRRRDFDAKGVLAGSGELMSRSPIKRNDSRTRCGGEGPAADAKSFQHTPNEGLAFARSDGCAVHRLEQRRGRAQEPTEGPTQTVSKYTQNARPMPSGGQLLGATGGMLIGTLLDEFARTNQATELVTKCVGDRVGIATALERT